MREDNSHAEHQVNAAGLDGRLIGSWRVSTADFQLVLANPHNIHDEEEQEYPEGGAKAWSVVFGAWCAMIPAMGLLNSLAVLQAWLSEHDLKGMPESTTGWIFSGYAFFLFFCGAQIGKKPIQDWLCMY